MIKSKPQLIILSSHLNNTNEIIVYSKSNYSVHTHFWVGTECFVITENLSNSTWLITKICKNKSWSVILHIIKCKVFLLNKCDSLSWFQSTFYLSLIINRGNFLSLFLTNHSWQIVGKLHSEELSIGF